MAFFSSKSKTKTSATDRAKATFSATKLRQRLAANNALWQVSFLGLLAGMVTALVVVFFRLLFEYPLTHWLPGQTPESFESLPAHWRFALPVLGSLVIGGILLCFKAKHRSTSVSHILAQMQKKPQALPFKNALVQLIGGAIALLTGQSSGREGPVIHLGAAASTHLGKQLQVPNNNMAILVACGSAGAIAASFNTPLAGVIFAIEVFMLKPSLLGFTPIIIAAVTATLLHNALYGEPTLLMAANIDLINNQEIFFVIICGLLFGTLAALFTRTIKFTMSGKHWPVMVRMLIAGLVTGTIAIYIPQVMGTGMDSIAMAIEGNYGLQLLLLLTVAKLLATAISVGMGMPVGLIGPTLLMGACLGAGAGIVLNNLTINTVSTPGFYAMLGMAAMMSAVLQAPLAGLVALLELTQNPVIILPGMASVVVANLTCRHVFRQESIFWEILKKQKVSLTYHPIRQFLQEHGVTCLMTTHWTDDRQTAATQNQKLSHLATLQEARELFERYPIEYVLIEDKQQRVIGFLSKSQLDDFIKNSL